MGQRQYPPARHNAAFATEITRHDHARLLETDEYQAGVDGGVEPVHPLKHWLKFPDSRHSGILGDLPLYTMVVRLIEKLGDYAAPHQAEYGHFRTFVAITEKIRTIFDSNLVAWSNYVNRRLLLEEMPTITGFE